MKVIKSHDINGNLCLDVEVSLTDRIGSVEIDDVSVGLLRGDRFALNFIFRSDFTQPTTIRNRVQAICKKFEQNYLFEPRYIITLQSDDTYCHIENEKTTRYFYIESKEDFYRTINLIFVKSRNVYFMTSDLNFKDELDELCLQENINHKY